MTESQQRRRPRNVFEHALEQGLFGARWLMAPFYIGLVAALALLLAVFVRELIQGAPAALESPEQAILLVLSLIDLSLAGNLVLIVTLSGYENFVSKIDTGDHVDRPSWMGAIDFSGMKLKLIGSIVAISAISLLRAFMQLAGGAEGGAGHGVPLETATLMWMVGLHVTFLFSGVMFALTDWLAEKAAHGHGVDRG